MKFKETIEELYADILTSMDSICITEKIKRCKYFLGLEEGDSLGDFYFKNINENIKGVIYTPPELATFMIKNTIAEEVINNPFIKILDPSCGCGNILMKVFDILEKTYLNNLLVINKKHNLKLNRANLSKHIIDNNLYGIDTDAVALKVLGIELFHRSGHVNNENLINLDFLTEDTEKRFHIIIGNPPYIGIRSMEKEYADILREKYYPVFNDKSDISYCFFVKALQCVEVHYKITFITSRYFMEALSGMKLREFLMSHSRIHRIIDFYGIRPFKNVGIDPAIIFLGHQSNNDIIVSKPKSEIKQNALINEEKFNTFCVKREYLKDDPWRLQEKQALNIMEKIEKSCRKRLSDLCISYQGIITGLDKAFIVTEDIIEKYQLEQSLIKPWIKSSNITKVEVLKSKLFIIYSNLIENEEQYPNAIQYIGSYKERLMNRRECRQGKRNWYELQWGRVEELFQREKIIFPYKSEKNRFVIDKGNYFSADVYALVIKESSEVDYEFLKRILNSDIYEFYFKCFAKKLGGKLYEYYPNNLNRLFIPTSEVYNIKSEEDLYSYFNLSTEDIKYIKESKGGC